MVARLRVCAGRQVTVWRDGCRFSQRYSRGAPLEPLQRTQLEAGEPEAAQRGTRVRVWTGAR